MPQLGTTGLEVFALCLGGNVFGWTIDEAGSFAVLDAYAAAGGNFVDTADVYSSWVPGNSGGESETIIGSWMAARGNRDQVVVATKVGQLDGVTGLSRASVTKACDDSLRRLQTDYIDLYFAHVDDADTPQEETLRALDDLLRAGKIRAIGASNFRPDRLSSALEISDRAGLAAYGVTQPDYSLMMRRRYEGPMEQICLEHDVACTPYSGLARGFLTGKYRPGGPEVHSPRAATASPYLDDPRAPAVLEALDEVAAAHGATQAAVALAWLLARPGVVAPLASARTPEQLADLLPAVALQLTADEVERLSAASA